jgi:hypothetical protein
MTANTITESRLRELLAIIDDARQNVSCMIDELSTGNLAPKDASKYVNDAVREITKAAKP